jgi:hypothetical protein
MTEEQSRTLNGTWDWFGNEANVKKFMRGGVVRSRDWESVWTLGMRGLGDVENTALNATSESDIVNWQVDTLVDVLEVPRQEIPKILVLFDELGSYFEEQHMQIEDDITLMWPDDNAGSIMRLPNSTTRDRSGGNGIYYHFDMNAPPRNYKWINTIQLIKTWQELRTAYNHGAQEVWMFNIGDIKPLEIPLSFAFDMGYDVDRFQDLDSTYGWLEYWGNKHFGNGVLGKSLPVAEDTAGIMTEYGRLIIRLKYEQLSSEPYFFSLTSYNEAERNVAEWMRLAEWANQTYDKLDTLTQYAFFEVRTRLI